MSKIRGESGKHSTTAHETSEEKSKKIIESLEYAAEEVRFSKVLM